MNQVTDIDVINKQEWQHFVSQHPEATFFHSLAYFEAFTSSSQAKAHFVAIVNDDGQIQALSVFLILQEAGRVKSYFSRRAIAMVPPLLKVKDESILNQLLIAQNKYLSSRAIYFEIRNALVSEFAKLYELLGFSSINHLNILLDLRLSKEDIYNGFSSSSRNKIKIANANGLQFRDLDLDLEVNQLYALLESVYNRIKLPLIPFDAFKQAVINLNKNSHLWAVGVYSGTRLLSVMLVTLYNKQLYSWYMASERSQIAKGATDMLVWNLLEKAKNQGFEYFDWGGAGMPDVDYSVRNFKLKFGGEIIEDKRYRFICKPILYKLSLWGFNVLRILKFR